MIVGFFMGVLSVGEGGRRAAGVTRGSSGDQAVFIRWVLAVPNPAVVVDEAAVGELTAACMAVAGGGASGLA
jgi:hypothetical protein